MSLPSYDPHTGRPCFAAPITYDPDDFAYSVPYAVPSADFNKGIYAGSGSFWIPTWNSTLILPYTKTTDLFDGDGIPSSAQDETTQRNACLAWIAGLTVPYEDDQDVDPYTGGMGTDVGPLCYFRDWTNPNTFPQYRVAVSEFTHCGSTVVPVTRDSLLWAGRSCVGMDITHIWLDATKSTSGSYWQNLDATHTLRVVPYWVTDFGDADELADLPWHPDALDALDGFELTAWGEQTIDVTSLGLTQQSGKRLVLISYFPFIMPDHWLFGTPSERFGGVLRPVSYKLATP